MAEFFSHLSRAVDDGHSKKEGPYKGRKFIFHGSFKHKRDAIEREKEVEGAFILERKGKFVVVTERKKR